METSLLTKVPKLEVKRLDENALLPQKAHYGDLGYDLFALEDTVLNPGTVTLVRTGIACNFPPGVGALLRDRSSIATKREVFVCAGVIDQGYTGEIKVAFFNPGHPVLACSASVAPVRTEILPYCEVRNDGYEQFKKGDKIAQMILTPVISIPVEEVNDLANTARGTGGFGSTGS